MQKKSRLWITLFGGGILACLILVVLVYAYFGFTSNTAGPSIPFVFITEVSPDNPAIVDQPVIVFGQAQDPDGIVEVQLWVNGQEVASQSNLGTGQNTTIDISQAWIPTGAGSYLFVLQAIDGKGFTGQSDPVAIQAADRTYSYEVASGDTVENIANGLGTTPEDIRDLNPGIEDAPTPGTSIYVPPIPPGGGGEGEDIPRVDPPPAPPPPSGDGTPAEPASPPWWSFFPLPDRLLCLINPDWCATPRSGEEGMSPPTGVSARLEETCRVVVNWQDESENELGFRLYRTHLGAGTDPELIATFASSPGSGGRLSYTDEWPPFGRFTYAVTAYDGSGEYWSSPSEVIEALCLTLETTDTISVSVEALEMTVSDPFDRLYCYASLAGSPFERVPLGSSFIELESGAWNIAEHFSGSNKRTVRINRSTPLEIQAECLGWQGGTLVNLGRFSRSHPPEEWDGRLLTAGPSDSRFNVTYRINTLVPEEVETGTWPYTDASIPPPFNLHTKEYYYRCSGEPRDPDEILDLCNLVDLPGIAWDFSLPGGMPEELYFKVYVRRADEDTPSHYYTQPENLPAPQILVEECGSPAFYSVSAVVGHDPLTGEDIESPLSEELEVPPSCPQLEITLINMHAYSTPDGDPGTDFCLSDCGAEVEAYGWIQVGSKRIRWNNHCDAGPGEGCISGGQSFTPVSQGGIIDWSNEYLNIGSGGGRNQNIFRISIPEETGLSFRFSFYDHDHISPDDIWCGWSTSDLFIEAVPARSLEEWLIFDREVDVLPSANSTCMITFRVRGVER